MNRECRGTKICSVFLSLLRYIPCVYAVLQGDSVDKKAGFSNN